MSKFFRALELAEQNQAPPRLPAPPEPIPERGPAPAETVPHRALPSPLEVSRGGAKGIEEHLVSLLEPTSFAAEQYRVLRHLIEQLHKSTDLSVVAVSSAGVADGKTTTAINLAGALAQAPDARVLLVDADLRVPALATRLGCDTRPGLVDAILDGDLPLEAVVQVRPTLNLSVLAAGQPPSAPYEVLKSPRVGGLLAEARRRYDYIVLDLPPLVSVPDGRVIGKLVDGFLIVVAAHRTSRQLLEEALSIPEAGKVVGLVFNGDDRHLSRNSYESYASRHSWGRNGRKETASDD
jgi:capsular exopolysaccharide synthesis family protein